MHFSKMSAINASVPPSKQHCMQFPPYKISTITAVGHVTCTETLNLEQLYESVNVLSSSTSDDNDRGFLYIEFAAKRDNVMTKGFHKKMTVKHRRIRSTKRFDNQVTVLIAHGPSDSGKRYTTNMKIFKNGNIQMTGLKSVDQGHSALDFIVNHIREVNKAYNIINKIEGVNLQAGGFKICMINSDFKTNLFIKRNKLYNIIRMQYGTFCRFEPTSYAGVALQPMMNKMSNDTSYICRCGTPCDGKGTGCGEGQCKRVTIAIFGSGSIIITGSQSFEQLDKAYAFVCDILKTNLDEVAIVKAVE